LSTIIYKLNCRPDAGTHDIAVIYAVQTAGTGRSWRRPGGRHVDADHAQRQARAGRQVRQAVAPPGAAASAGQGAADGRQLAWWLPLGTAVIALVSVVGWARARAAPDMTR
jgi:hypothetical protein